LIGESPLLEVRKSLGDLRALNGEPLGMLPRF